MAKKWINCIMNLKRITCRRNWERKMKTMQLPRHRFINFWIIDRAAYEAPPNGAISRISQSQFQWTILIFSRIVSTTQMYDFGFYAIRSVNLEWCDHLLSLSHSRRSNKRSEFKMGRFWHMLDVLLLSSNRNHSNYCLDCFNFNKSSWGWTKFV